VAVLTLSNLPQASHLNHWENSHFQVDHQSRPATGVVSTLSHLQWAASWETIRQTCFLPSMQAGLAIQLLFDFCCKSMLFDLLHQLVNGDSVSIIGHEQ